MPVEYKSDYILASLMLTIFGDVAVAECFIAVMLRSKNISGLTGKISRRTPRIGQAVFPIPGVFG